MSGKLNQKQHYHTTTPRGFSATLKKSVLRSRPSSAKAAMQQGYHGDAESPSISHAPLRRAHSGSLESVDGIPGFKNSPRLVRWFAGENYDFHNPKNLQHLLSMLQQPGSEKVLVPNEEGDLPLHSIVRQYRQDKEELLVALLTYSSVDVNSRGKGGMTALHYAVQVYDIATVQLLLAFGANVNQVNLRNHTPLDIATFLWLTQERLTRVNKGTNNLETVCEERLPSHIQTYPDVTSSPMLSPQLRRVPHRVVTRSDSSSSWVVVDQETALPPSGIATPSSDSEDSHGGECSINDSQISQDDSREFTSSVMPIKSADLNDEVPEDDVLPGLGANSAQLKPTEAILNLLYSVNALSGKAVTHKFRKVSFLSSFCESDEFQQQLEAHKRPNPFLDSNEVERSVKLRDYIDGKTVLSLYEELEFNINKRMRSQSSLSGVTDEDIAIAMQQKEMYRFNKTSKEGLGFKVNGGSRLLFLDGGGMKGLVQIEVMRQLEEATGRKITELFDWIIGSSIGAILALGLVYAKKSLKDLQQLCFKLKEDVFAKPRAGVAFNTKAMEQMIVDEFGYDMTMNSIKRPKVLIGAVNKKTAPPQLHFFNNCFNDRFSETPVWKVARYTTAAPMFFTEFEGYVDGGVLANNPCDYGLTAIRNFYREKKVKLPISMVVSIGTGVYPPEEIGNIDAQEFLFFGRHWFNVNDTLKKRTQNLISLLTNALVESEIVAKNCQMRCHEQDIPYYRFSPHLNHVVAAGETDMDKLLDMMLQARIQTPQQHLDELVALFQLVADASKKNRYRQSRNFAETHPHDS